MKPIRATVLGVAAVVAGGALVAVLVDQRSDEDTVARDEVAASPSASPSGSPTPTAFSPLDFGDEPAVEQPYKTRAQTAVADGLVTMVPAGLPDGWNALGGGYRAEGPQWWRMEFDGPEGPVVLDQLARPRARILADHRSSLEQHEDVELDASGSGAWQHHSGESTTVLSYRVKGSTVVVQAADLETASSLARTLLPAEGDASAEE